VPNAVAIARAYGSCQRVRIAAALGLSRALRGHPWWALRASASPRFVIRGCRGDVGTGVGLSRTSVTSVPQCVVIECEEWTWLKAAIVGMGWSGSTSSGSIGSKDSSR